MLTHTLVCHSGAKEKIHPCDRGGCVQVFKSNEDLAVHKRWHDRDRTQTPCRYTDRGCTYKTAFKHTRLAQEIFTCTHRSEEETAAVTVTTCGLGG